MGLLSDYADTQGGMPGLLGFTPQSFASAYPQVAAMTAHGPASMFGGYVPPADPNAAAQPFAAPDMSSAMPAMNMGHGGLFGTGITSGGQAPAMPGAPDMSHPSMASLPMGANQGSPMAGFRPLGLAALGSFGGGR